MAQGAGRQRPAVGSQSGVALEQSVLPWHWTQARVTTSQRGVTPPQSVSAVQPTQRWPRHREAAEAGQPTPSSHWTQKPSSQRGAVAGQTATEAQVVAQ